MSTPIAFCLIGAGIWARDQHLPAILSNPDVALKAVYSRSRASAEKLSQTIKHHVEIYYEDPPSVDRNLAALLARPDVEAVVCCLPILVQLDVVKKCLLSGKHVQSEKPIAGDVETAEKMIMWYREAQRSQKIKQGLIWGVAEEFRLMPSFGHMREEVKRLGKVQTFYAQGYSLLDKQNRFFETSWRKVPGYQGGFLLDGGVHWAAALIHVLGPQNRITQVSAFTTLLREHLAPVDLMTAIVRLESGANGCFGYSAGIEHKRGSGVDFEFVCENGRVQFDMHEGKGRVSVVESGIKQPAVRLFDSALNSQYEIATFVASIKSGREMPGETPEAAMLDLHLVQSMLKSGKEYGVPQKIDIKSE